MQLPVCSDWKDNTIRTKVTYLDRYNEKLRNYWMRNISSLHRYWILSKNGNTFYLICKNRTIREKLINHLIKEEYVLSHYLPLHKSEYYSGKHDDESSNEWKIQWNLIRFLFFDLTERQVDEIIERPVISMQIFKNKTDLIVFAQDFSCDNLHPAFKTCLRCRRCSCYLNYAIDCR